MIGKRAQAAMEFLMTYGWAILAAVIVVGVLWYMIGSPANLAGNSFSMSQPFVGGNMNISTGEVYVEVRNGGGESVTISNVTAGVCTWTGSQSVADGALQVFRLTCSSSLTSGDKFAENVILHYTKGSSTLAQTATGTIRGVVP